MAPKDKYTDPKLRDEVKEEIHNSDKGGAPGQWSARKAQMMASEYKKRGGGYTTDKEQKDESQKHLDNWTEEEWQTKEGSGHAKKEDGTEKRYLPKKAWEKMSEEEKQQTDDKKQKEGKKGKQFVGNTSKAKQARKQASKNDKKDDEEEDDEEAGESGNEDEAESDDDVEENEEEDDEEQEEEEEEEDEDEDDEQPRGQKRARGKNVQSGSSKKQKGNSKQSKTNGTVGSRKDPAEPPAPAGSRDRLPKKGQKVHWKALPGYVEGKVTEIVYSEKKVDGKQIKASKDDPRIVLKSSSSGKTAVHKPEVVFFK